MQWIVGESKWNITEWNRMSWNVKVTQQNVVEQNGMWWNGVQCDAVEGTRRVWSAMGHYLREWNAMEHNGMLGRAGRTLTSGMECHVMVM